MQVMTGKMNKKTIIGIIIIAGVAIGAVVWQKSIPDQSPLNLDRTTRSPVSQEKTVRPLRVVTSSWEPFMYEVDGEARGFSVAMLERIMRELDVAYSLEFYPFSRALRLVAAGEADALLNGGYALEREEYLYYTSAQRDFVQAGGQMPKAIVAPVEYVLFVRKLLAPNVRFDSAAQVRADDYRVGVRQDYTYPPGIESAGWQRREFISDEKGLQALAEGTIDVFLAEKIVGIDTLRALELEDTITYIENEKGEGLFPGYLLFSKHSDYPDIEQLVSKVDSTILDLRNQGVYESLFNTYLSRPDIPTQLFDISLRLDEASLADASELVAEVSFESFGREPTPVDLTFVVFDADNNTVSTDQTAITVETQRVVRKKFTTLALDPGQYTLVLRTQYNDDVHDEFQQAFTIEKASWWQSFNNWLQGIFK